MSKIKKIQNVLENYQKLARLMDDRSKLIKELAASNSILKQLKSDLKSSLFQLSLDEDKLAESMKNDMLVDLGVKKL